MAVSTVTDCELYNVHEMALDMENFVHFITTFPDLLIICGLKQILEEMELVLGNQSLDQLLSYDTTLTKFINTGLRIGSLLHFL